MMTPLRERLPTAIWAGACGLATAVGGLLTWVSAHGPRPTMGMDHSSFSKMLVYTLVGNAAFLSSVGFAVLLFGMLMVIGAATGFRIFTVLGAILALGAAGMWLGLVTHHYNTPRLPNSHYINPANLPWSALREGAWLTLCGGVLGLVSTLVPGGWSPVLGRAPRRSNSNEEPVGRVSVRQ